MPSERELHHVIAGLIPDQKGGEYEFLRGTAGGNSLPSAPSGDLAQPARNLPQKYAANGKHRL